MSSPTEPIATFVPNDTPTPKGTHDSKDLVGMIDYALLIDSTGSMASAIRAAKDYAYENVMGLKNRSNEPDLFRVVCICFRDPVDCPRDENALLNFTGSVPDLQAFLDRQHATGGGDYAEDWAGAFRMALSRLTWREDSVKMILVIADAPGHGLHLDSHYEPERPKIIQALKDIAAKQIRLGFVEIQQDHGESPITNAMNEAAQIYLANGGITCTVDAVEFGGMPITDCPPAPLVYRSHIPGDPPSRPVRSPPHPIMAPFGMSTEPAPGAAVPQLSPPPASTSIAQQISFTSHRMLSTTGYSSVRTPPPSLPPAGTPFNPFSATPSASPPYPSSPYPPYPPTVPETSKPSSKAPPS